MLQNNFIEWLGLYRLSPYFYLNYKSQYLSHHISYIIILGFLEFSFFPKILPSYLHFDLLTPWLVLIYISQPHLRALLLGTFICITKEAHFIVPAGYFFVPYIMIGCLVFLIREHISWEKNTSWTFMILIGQMIMTALHLAINPINDSTSLAYYTSHGLQFMSSITLGFLMILYNKSEKNYWTRPTN